MQAMARKLNKVSDILRAAVDASDRTRYRICKDADIDQATLSRFMHRKSGLSMEAIDRLVETLGLELKPKQPASKRAKKGR